MYLTQWKCIYRNSQNRERSLITLIRDTVHAKSNSNKEKTLSERHTKHFIICMVCVCLDLNIKLKLKCRCLFASYHVLSQTLYSMLRALQKIFLKCLSIRGPPDVSTLVPVGPKYTVKWFCPLMQIEVVEVGQDTLQSRESVSIARRHSITGTSGLSTLANMQLFQWTSTGGECWNHYI